MSTDRGFTLVELMVGMAIGLVVISAMLALIQVTTKDQARVTSRVAANQRARPVMTRVIDALHSGCVAPGVAPVLAGSTGSELRLVSESGSEVSPTPDKHVVTWTGSALTESIYPATGGAPPTWTFSGTASLTRELLSDVGQGAVGDPPSSVPVFQYFSYLGGEVSPTPLPTPLTAEHAAQTVRVTVSFATAPTSTPAPDPEAPITLSDSATLRLEPASEDTSEVNLPCV